MREADDRGDEHVGAGDQLRRHGNVGRADGGRGDVVAERQLDTRAHGVEVELGPEQRVVDRLGDLTVLQRVDPDSAAYNHDARIRQ